MNVQELIDQLQLIEDKSQPVCIADWNESYMRPCQFRYVHESNGEYFIDGKGNDTGNYVCLDD